jgi:hypothetical protein
MANISAKSNNNNRQRRTRPEQVSFVIERVDHLHLEVLRAAFPTAAVEGETLNGLGELRAAMQNAELDRERAKLVEAIARRGNGAGA